MTSLYAFVTSTKAYVDDAEDARNSTLLKRTGPPRDDAQQTVRPAEHAQRHEPRRAACNGCEADVGDYA